MPEKKTLQSASTANWIKQKKKERKKKKPKNNNKNP